MLCSVKNGMDKRIDESFLWWFGHIEGMGSSRAAKMVYKEEFTESHLVG